MKKSSIFRIIATFKSEGTLYSSKDGININTLKPQTFTPYAEHPVYCIYEYVHVYILTFTRYLGVWNKILRKILRIKFFFFTPFHDSLLEFWTVCGQLTHHYYKSCLTKRHLRRNIFTRHLISLGPKAEIFTNRVNQMT